MCHYIVRAVLLLGHEGSGGCGPAVVALQGRRAMVAEPTTTTRMADDATREEGRATMTRNKSRRLMMQGNGKVAMIRAGILR